LGLLFSNGLGVKQDPAEGANWYRTSAQQGNVKAEVHLGLLYQIGHGVEQNYLEAMAWYLRAADKGDSEAQNAIGRLYQEGHGVNQDYAKAREWYRKAADQGNATAENDIGSLYANGLGVPQDHSKAEEWFKKANDHVLLPGGIRPPRAIFSPAPDYSKEAREAKFQGTCVLSLIVGADGNPRDIKVLKSLGKGLDEKAIDAVKTWKFEPATKDGVPVAVQIAIEVDFRLK
jgi:TonB family protein